MATFGETGTGNENQTIGFADYWKQGSEFTLLEDGQVTKISIYGTIPNGRVFYLCIYDDDNNGDAGTLLATSEELTGDGTQHWYDAVGGDLPKNLSAGNYILAICSSSGDNYLIRSQTFTGDYVDRQNDTPPPNNPWGSHNKYTGRHLCIYATYTPSGATYTKTWTTDVLFKKLDVLKTFGADVDFLKKDVVKSFAVDARFGALVTYTISRQIDVLFEKLGITKTFGVDAYFGEVGAVAYTKSFALDVVFAYKVRLPEIWLDEEGRIVLNVSRPYVWVGS